MAKMRPTYGTARVARRTKHNKRGKRKESIRTCKRCGCFMKRKNVCCHCDRTTGTKHDTQSTSVSGGSKPGETIDGTNSQCHDDDDISCDHLECFNCRRSEINLEEISTEKISTKRKYCLFSVGDIRQKGSIALCTECAEAIEKGRVYNEVTGPGWPAFVWSILSDRRCRETHGDELWRLIPTTWRPWWLNAVSRSWADTAITLHEPTPFFKDVTKEKMALDAAISELTWRELVNAVDMHASIPYVKCPWGCGEFYNKAKSIELDVVFKTFVGEREKQLWMSKNYRFKFMTGARADYLTSAHPILQNPAWMCSPSIFAPPGRLPVVLTCDFHNRGSTLKYIHVPTNPTGTIMCESVDQIASAVLVPKTVHVAKARAYTNSFQMNRLDGTYEGVDTVVLTDHGCFDRTNRLADKRDALSTACRADVASHMEDLVKQEVIPAWLAKDKLEYANELFPEDDIPGILARHCRGATYITLEDAIEMELWLKRQQGSVVVATYPRADGSSTERTINYVETWPQMLVWVHPVDKFGAAFPALPKYHNSPSNCRTLWVLSAMLSYVGRLWQIIARNVKRTTDWYGWVLTYAARECLTGSNVKGSNNNPFRKAIHHASLTQQLFSSYDNGQYSPQLIAALFATSDLSNTIFLIKSTDLGNTTWEGVSQDILICYQEAGQHVLAPETIQRHSDGKMWELRFVVRTDLQPLSASWSATIYCRHGTSDFPGWWIHRMGELDSRHLSKDGLAAHLREWWDVCIFVTTDRQDMNALKERYLMASGGQVAVRCEQHNRTPLVVAPAKKSVLCCYCDGNSYYKCPTPSCTVGVCRKHHAELVENSDGSPIFLRRGQQYPRTEAKPSDNSTHEDPNFTCHDEHRATPDSSIHDTFMVEMDEVECHNEADDKSNEQVEEGKYEIDTLDLEEDWEGLNTIGNLDDYPIAAQEHVEQDLLDATLLNQIHDDVDFKLLLKAKSFAASSSSTRSSPKSSPDAAKTNIDDHQHHEKPFVETESYDINDSDWVTNNVVPTDHLDLEDNDDADSCNLWFPTTNAGREAVTLDNPRHAIACCDGSLIGAIPVGCLNSPAILKRHGIATLLEHGRTRMMDPATLCFTDHRYQFYAMDVCTNLGLRGQDTRLVISRGFAHLQGDGGIRAKDADSGDQLMFDTDSVDSRSNVNKLAAALNKHKGSLFYTHTVV